VSGRLADAKGVAGASFPAERTGKAIVYATNFCSRSLRVFGWFLVQVGFLIGDDPVFAG
jgi:hypothetical protein